MPTESASEEKLEAAPHRATRIARRHRRHPVAEIRQVAADQALIMLAVAMVAGFSVGGGMNPQLGRTIFVAILAAEWRPP
jgi:hypothetical protein